MKIIQCEQGTQEWHDERRAKVTGKKLGNIMGTPAARITQMAELIAEEATEQTKVNRTSIEMERGTAEEPFAIKQFEKITKKIVAKIGICVSDEFPWLACSPDGFIADKKGEYTEALEIKCPDSKQAVLYRMENMLDPNLTGLLTAKGELRATAPFLGVPIEYKWQIINYFLVNEKLETLYFVVYDARFINEKEKAYTVVVQRNHLLVQEAIQQATVELARFREDWLAYKEVVLPSNF